MDRWIFFQECSSEGWISLAADIVLVCLAVFSAATDLYRGKVYNAVTMPGLLAGLAFSVQRAGAPGILDVFCAVGFTGLVLFPFYKAGGLGAGDIKLLMAAAPFMGVRWFLFCTVLSFLIGAVISAVLLIRYRDLSRTVHFAVPIGISVMLCLLLEQVGIQSPSLF